MNCRRVDHIIVEYAEGALPVADELCVDIHLVQCESCKRELAELTELQRAFRMESDEPVPSPETLQLLRRLDGLATAPTAVPAPRLTIARTALAVGMLAVIAGASIFAGTRAPLEDLSVDAPAFAAERDTITRGQYAFDLSTFEMLPSNEPDRES